MSTSANVIDYTIRRNGKRVGRHSQSMLCKYAHHELLKYQPEDEFTIQGHWSNEDEVVQDYDEKLLSDFLNPYRDMGRRYRDGCTIEEVFTAPKGKWGVPDLSAVKAARTERKQGAPNEV